MLMLRKCFLKWINWILGTASIWIKPETPTTLVCNSLEAKIKITTLNHKWIICTAKTWFWTKLTTTQLTIKTWNFSFIRRRRWTSHQKSCKVQLQTSEVIHQIKFWVIVAKLLRVTVGNYKSKGLISPKQSKLHQKCVEITLTIRCEKCKI